MNIVNLRTLLVLWLSGWSTTVIAAAICEQKCEIQRRYISQRWGHFLAGRYANNCLRTCRINSNSILRPVVPTLPSTQRPVATSSQRPTSTPGLVIIPFQPVTSRTEPPVQPTTRTTQPPVHPTTKRTLPSVQPTTKRTIPSVQPTTKRTLPSVQPTTKRTLPSVQPTTKRTLPSVQPTTKRTLPSVQPTTKRTQTSVQPTTKRTLPSVQPTTKRTLPSVQPTTKRTLPSVQPTTKRTQPSVQPTTKRTLPSVQPTTKRTLPSVQPTPKRTQPSVQPKTKTTQSPVQPMTAKTSPPLPLTSRATQLPNFPTCGLGAPTSRIVGGDRADECEYPWMAAISISTWFCGGTILDEMHILSAAHCFRRISGDLVRADKVLVRVGSSRLSNMRYHSIAKFQIDDRHVRYINDYDVAIVTLKEPLTFSHCISPICLPEDMPEVNENDICYVAGWGSMEFYSRKQEPSLLKVRIPLVSQPRCESIFNKNYEYVNELKFCAGDLVNGGIDSCRGDSGGPYMCLRQGVWYQFGIVSFGVNCALRYRPGIYTRITHPKIRDFIDSVVKDQL